jgi:hypothetical protein
MANRENAFFEARSCYPLAVMKTLETWGGRATFRYSGAASTGTDIWFGKSKRPFHMSGEQYSRLLNHFDNCEVPLGTSRTAPPTGSVGAWLQENVGATAIASYVGSILVHEGFAVRAPKGDRIKFHV